MIEIKNKQVYSTNNKYIHRIGTETYFKKSMVFPNDTIDNFEEVDEIPKYTKAEYEAKVAELIRQKYTQDEEFALQRKMINATMLPSTLDDSIVENIFSQYQEYNYFVEECKFKAKEELSNGKEI